MTSDDVSNQDFQQCDDESSAQVFCGEHETLKSASSALEVRSDYSYIALLFVRKFLITSTGIQRKRVDT